MPAYYTVVQCVPDPIADERINVGIVVFGDGRIRTRFLTDWSRVERFAQDDIGSVQEFVQQLEDATSGTVQGAFDGPFGRRAVDETQLREMIDGFANNIQFSPPEPSLQDPDALLSELAGLFLKERRPRRPVGRSRQAAGRFAVRTVRAAFAELIGVRLAEHYVQPSYTLAGRIFPRRKVDLAVKNGRVYSASEALSFEIKDVFELERQAHDAVHTLDDIRDTQPGIRLAVIALPPRKSLPGFRAAEERFLETREACERANIVLITEDETASWAQDLAHDFAGELDAHAREAVRFYRAN